MRFNFTPQNKSPRAVDRHIAWQPLSNSSIALALPPSLSCPTPPVCMNMALVGGRALQCAILGSPAGETTLSPCMCTIGESHVVCRGARKGFPRQANLTFNLATTSSPARIPRVTWQSARPGDGRCTCMLTSRHQ